MGALDWEATEDESKSRQHVGLFGSVVWFIWGLCVSAFEATQDYIAFR